MRGVGLILTVFVLALAACGGPTVDDEGADIEPRVDISEFEDPLGPEAPEIESQPLFESEPTPTVDPLFNPPTPEATDESTPEATPDADSTAGPGDLFEGG